jgi:probable FeS assembly SUF system protein SufT
MERREPVSLKRAVEVTLVPSGEKHVIPEGAMVMPQQELGGHFTIMLGHGGLARLANEDADALGEAYAERARKVAELEKDRLAAATGQPFDVERVWDALKKVFDPEIPASIVDLGLVYELVHAERAEGGRKVTIRMTLTAPGCGVAPMILDDVRERVAKVPGVGEVEVDLVFDPPWTPEKMSESARLQLGFW